MGISLIVRAERSSWLSPAVASRVSTMAVQLNCSPNNANLFTVPNPNSSTIPLNSSISNRYLSSIHQFSTQNSVISNKLIKLIWVKEFKRVVYWIETGLLLLQKGNARNVAYVERRYNGGAYHGVMTIHFGQAQSVIGKVRQKNVIFGRAIGFHDPFLVGHVVDTEIGSYLPTIWQMGVIVTRYCILSISYSASFRSAWYYRFIS